MSIAVDRQGCHGFAAVVSVAYLVLVIGIAGPASGQSICGEGWASQTFSYVSGEQVFVVPDGITSVVIHAWGAQGANGEGAAGGVGGLGAYATGALSVTPGETLYVVVGGQSDGFNGGGPGGAGNAGNGGGASDVRAGGNAIGDRVLVAGGGGGGGATGCVAAHAGGAGGAGGGGAGAKGADSPNGGGGFGGTLGAGGAEGVGCNYALGLPGLANGTGGDGQICCCATQPGGGGGGGGAIVGGGGGGGSAGTVACSGNDKGGGGGGAGGSSDVSGVASGATSDGARAGDGEIVICYQQQAGEAIPTTSTLGLILLAGLVALSGAVVLRRVLG